MCDHLMYHLLVVIRPKMRGIESAYSVFHRIFNILSIYRLFIGGHHRIRVQSIRLTQTQQNFASFIGPLYYLDAMTTGSGGIIETVEMYQLNPGKNAKGVIYHLFKYKLGQNPEPKMDKYLYETFDAFVRNKEHIFINLEYLRRAKESMYKLLMHSIEKGDEFKDDSDETNLIRPACATIFKKTKTLYIVASFYSFSLIGFLSVLQLSEWQKVTIAAYWASKLWGSSKRVAIEKEYQSKNYKIAFEKESYKYILTITPL